MFDKQQFYPAYSPSRNVFCTNERTSYSSFPDKFRYGSTAAFVGIIGIKPSTSLLSIQLWNNPLINFWSFFYWNFASSYLKPSILAYKLKMNRYCIKFQRIFCAPQQFLQVKFQVIPRLAFDIMYQRVASGPYSLKFQKDLQHSLNVWTFFVRFSKTNETTFYRLLYQNQSTNSVGIKPSTGLIQQ
jgi:hypothetical protein